MRTAAILALCLLPTALPGCDEAEGRPFDAGDGRTLTLLSLDAETKEAANGRTVAYLVAIFEEPDGMTGDERRPLAEQLCPRVLAEAGAPEEVDGASLETVLIKYREKGREILGVSFGSSTNYWVELSRGECITRS
jgi:hypothetical protein